jgi:hypothetical protein
MHTNSSCCGVTLIACEYVLLEHTRGRNTRSIEWHQNDISVDQEVLDCSTNVGLTSTGVTPCNVQQRLTLHVEKPLSLS